MYTNMNIVDTERARERDIYIYIYTHSKHTYIYIYIYMFFFILIYSQLFIIMPEPRTPKPAWYRFAATERPMKSFLK